MPRLTECIKELCVFLPELSQKHLYFSFITKQILSDDQDYLSLFEAILPTLSIDLQKSFKDHVLEKFKMAKGLNVVNIYAKFCNMASQEEDFENMVLTFFKMYPVMREQILLNVPQVFQAVEKSKI